MLNFNIEKGHSISNLFLQTGIPDFDAACAYIANLPYRRNSNKTNLMLVFEERCGTCSTKHAVLRKLCIENGHPEVGLKMALFRMDARYDPRIRQCLERYGLPYIPEAHNYLQIEDAYFDFTRVGAAYTDFKDQLIDEISIEYPQIDEFKTAYHQSYLRHWIETAEIPYTLPEILDIRESCIRTLQGHLS